MRALFDLILIISTLVGGGYIARETLYKMQELTFKRIDKGFSSTSELNRGLWQGSSSNKKKKIKKEANAQNSKKKNF